VRPGSLLDRRMVELAARRIPFVKATVVRARKPASAHPGDTALVLEDGRVEGFVGGVCAEATVRLQALRALGSGEPVLLRISPDPPPDGAAGREPRIEDGALAVANPCLSGGELEIFLEPLRPVPRVLVLGDTPIGRGLIAFGPSLDYDIRGAVPEEVTPEVLAGAAALIVASHGREEEPVLTLAARAGVPYVALVASRRRGAAVLDSLDLAPEQRARIRNPAGLWIGARTPEEVALSILAELVATVHGVDARAGGAAEVDAAVEDTASRHGHATSMGPQTAVDPVCGMAVAVLSDTPHVDAGGERRWFCCTGCRDGYAADPSRYPVAA
jgi:xanthine dehydrogenase accessory factor